MKTPEVLSHPQSEALLHTLSFNDAASGMMAPRTRNTLMALLMLDAGLRIGEVTNLTSPHLDNATREPCVLDLDSSVAEKACARIIPLTLRTLDAINDYLHNFYTPPLFDCVHWAFPGADHEHHLSTKQLRRIIQKAGKDALNLPVNPHMLRHTFATNLMRTTNIRIVQHLLGHKAISSTQIYTHPNNLDLKTAIRTLEPQTDIR